MQNNTQNNNKIDTRLYSEKTYEYIVKKILTGVYRAGEEIKVDNISKELGVSTMPVREALKWLAFQGVVEIKPRSKSLLIKPSENNVLDLIEAREFLEIHAVEKYLSNPEQRRIQGLKTIASQMETILNSEDLKLK